MHHFFKGAFFDFEVVRILGTAVYGGAEVGEVLEAVGGIRDGDGESWARAWGVQAARAEALAEQARRDGNSHAARQAFLRASNYTRASHYMRIAPGPDVCDRVNVLFRNAVSLLDHPVLFLDLPYNDVHLPAHLYLPSPACRLPGKVPLLISSCGADALQEELYYMHPAQGPALGYAVLTFEGPGQGISLRRHGLKMRPDWEVVVARVLDFIQDFAHTHPELDLDLDRIAIAGASLGGYFALRAASDPRIKACVALDPLYSFWDFATQHVSPTFIGAWDSGWLSNAFVDTVIGAMMKLQFQMRWEVSVAGAFFGLDSPALIMQEMKKYTLGLPDGGSFLQKVKCPVLVSGASESLYLHADHHTMRVYNALKNQAESDKELWMASTPGQGALQAKMGALQLANQKTFAFLDAKLGVKRPELLRSPNGSL